MTLSVDVAIQFDGWRNELPDLIDLSRQAASVSLETAAREPSSECELSLLFCDDARIRVLNRDWRGQDKPTNVLAFPAPDRGFAPVRWLGDVAIAFETARAEAGQEGKSLRDHVLHLIVHGTLHLIGYDHDTDERAEAMEGLERACLKRLGASDPYSEGEILIR